MYTRIVEITSKSGKARELCNTIKEKIVPILKKQTGFADETVLVSDAEPNRVLGLSFWESKEDAERYHREQYPQVHDTLKHLLEGEPVIRRFDVQTSTTHNGFREVCGAMRDTRLHSSGTYLVVANCGTRTAVDRSHASGEKCERNVAQEARRPLFC